MITVPMGERYCVTRESAIAMLPADEEILVTSNAENVFFNATWARADVIDAINHCTPELSGPIATADGFGLVIWHCGFAFFVFTGNPS